MFENNLFWLLLLLLSRCNREAPPLIDKGEGWTTNVINWNKVTANTPVLIPFDGFRATEAVGKSDDNAALIIKRGGCYDLEYLANINSFRVSGPHPPYRGIEVYLTVNGAPITAPVRVDPTGALFNKPATVAADKAENVRLNQGDEISVALRATTNGSSMTVTPSAWLDAYYIR